MATPTGFRTAYWFLGDDHAMSDDTSDAAAQHCPAQDCTVQYSNRCPGWLGYKPRHDADSSVSETDSTVCGGLFDYTCDECGRSYHTEKGLKIHQERVHHIT